MGIIFRQDGFQFDNLIVRRIKPAPSNCTTWTTEWEGLYRELVWWRPSQRFDPSQPFRAQLFPLLPGCHTVFCWGFILTRRDGKQLITKQSNGKDQSDRSKHSGQIRIPINPHKSHYWRTHPNPAKDSKPWSKVVLKCSSTKIRWNHCFGTKSTRISNFRCSP